MKKKNLPMAKNFDPCQPAQTVQADIGPHFLQVHEPFPKSRNLDSSKTKELAKDNFKFDSIGRKFSKRVDNTVLKGEIAQNEQFLLFPQCFQRTSTVDM